METLNVNNNLLMKLRLKGMLNTIDTRLMQARKDDLGLEGFLGLILQDEIDHRKNMKIQGLLKRACFRQNAALEEFDMSVSRGIEKGLLRDLGTCSFVADGINMIICGPTGVGKSYLSTAIGNCACRQGMATCFYKMNNLIEHATLSRVKGTYLNFLKKIHSYDLLIIDDFGIKPLEARGYQDFFDIVDERSEGKSTIITTQVPVENWSEIIADPVTCEAISDRLVSKAMKLQMKGDSYRKKAARKHCRPKDH